MSLKLILRNLSDLLPKAVEIHRHRRTWCSRDLICQFCLSWHCVEMNLYLLSFRSSSGKAPKRGNSDSMLHILLVNKHSFNYINEPLRLYNMWNSCILSVSRKSMKKHKWISHFSAPVIFSWCRKRHTGVLQAFLKHCDPWLFSQGHWPLLP